MKYDTYEYYLDGFIHKEEIHLSLDNIVTTFTIFLDNIETPFENKILAIKWLEKKSEIMNFTEEYNEI